MGQILGCPLAIVPVGCSPDRRYCGPCRGTVAQRRGSIPGVTAADVSVVFGRMPYSDGDSLRRFCVRTRAFPVAVASEYGASTIRG